ncbi:MAG: MBL fold metallo-hydrolase [Acidimicrobiia bacterium]|nr:MBL fold metallo-hydrolase [Acidimicrobiia bacterium]
MATHPLDLSDRVIDSGVVDEPVNRVNADVWELDNGLAYVESFSHSVVMRAGDGLACFDASSAGSGKQVVDALRTWSTAPVSHLVYTHGHADHVGGSGAFIADAAVRGARRPHVVGHAKVLARMQRYEDTSDWNVLINRRQFGGIRSEMSAPMNSMHDRARFLPTDTAKPDETFDDRLDVRLGDQVVQLHHARGETDDHLWAWVPEKKWMFTGDFVIWNFPNAGNPQKVQRYALEWAHALRAMIAQGPELLVPAHGLPIRGKKRIASVLGDIAGALEALVQQVLEMMNAGETLDSIIHTVKVPAEVLAKPYLRPLYDEPEFVVRGIWRLYGGWWDGAASRLKPAPDSVLGTEIASLAGGADVLIARAKGLAEDGDLRLACHLADFAAWAAPDDPTIHTRRAEIYNKRRDVELSLMSKGIFKAAARESEAVVKRHQP